MMPFPPKCLCVYFLNAYILFYNHREIIKTRKLALPYSDFISFPNNALYRKENPRSCFTFKFHASLASFNLQQLSSLVLAFTIFAVFEIIGLQQIAFSKKWSKQYSQSTSSSRTFSLLSTERWSLFPFPLNPGGIVTPLTSRIWHERCYVISKASL